MIFQETARAYSITPSPTMDVALCNYVKQSMGDKSQGLMGPKSIESNAINPFASDTVLSKILKTPP